MRAALLLVFASVAQGVTLSPATCDVAAVQAAVANASNAAGDVTIQLPACNQAWPWQ